MQDQSEPRGARAAIFLITALIALLVPAGTAPAQTTAGPDAAAGLSPRLLADASWHGRPIQQPWSVQRVALDAPDAAGLRSGTGFATAGGSERVRGLQRRLVRLGYRPGRIDGLFGPRTQAAVIAFQRKHALTQTGVAGAVTMRALRVRTSDRPAPAAEGPEPARAAAPQAPKDEPVRAAAPPEPESPAASSDASNDGGLDTTPFVLGLSTTASVAVLILIGLLAPRRPERRAPPTARRAGPRNGPAARAIGYSAGRETILRREEHEIAAGCDHRRLELVELVTDAVSGGVAGRDRPGLRRVLERIRDGDASTVVVSRLDRLGASDEEIQGVLWTMARNQASVIALHGDAETNGTARQGRAAWEEI